MVGLVIACVLNQPRSLQRCVAQPKLANRAGVVLQPHEAVACGLLMQHLGSGTHVQIQILANLANCPVVAACSMRHTLGRAAFA